MATMAENVIAAGFENRPPMLEKGMYDSWKTQIMLYIQGKENGEMLIDSIKNGPVKLLLDITVKDTYGVTDIHRPQNIIGHSQEEKLRYDSDIRAVSKQSQGYASNARMNQASGARVVNTVKNAWINQPRVIRCYNCNGKGHIAKQCTAKKRVKDSEWFKDNMLLAQAQAQAARFVLNNEQPDFLADSLEETDDYEDLYKCNLHGKFVSCWFFNDDTVEPHYDSDILSEVPHYDTYHDTDVLNSSVQEMGYIENIVSKNKSYDELTSNNNVISYADYMVTIGNDADNYVPPPLKKNDMILSVIEQIKSQVEKSNTVNQETQSVNESLTSELERYKERVRTLENKSKNSVSNSETFLDHELRTVICDRNRKVCDYEDRIFSQRKQMENLTNEVNFLKSGFETFKKEPSKIYEKNISEIVDLENAKKKLENIVYKGQFLKELRTNTFSDSDHEDANEHIKKVLEIVNLFHIPNITIDQVMLRAFLMSLTGAASRWLRNEPTGSITTWDGLKTKFLNKYCPPARTAKKMEEINNFQQEPDENLYQAWERFKELLMKCPQHYLTEKLAIQAQLNNLGREIKKVNEKVYAAQIGCEQCKGPHYTKDCPLKEEGKLLKKLTIRNLVDLFKEGDIKQQL
ncbi:integrase, catalytic region, zinc finger, CCHC-type containing protein [Tanacetum coccineum]